MGRLFVSTPWTVSGLNILQNACCQTQLKILNQTPCSKLSLIGDRMAALEGSLHCAWRISQIMSITPMPSDWTLQIISSLTPRMKSRKPSFETAYVFRFRPCLVPANFLFAKLTLIIKHPILKWKACITRCFPYSTWTAQLFAGSGIAGLCRACSCLWSRMSFLVPM